MASDPVRETIVAEVCRVLGLVTAGASYHSTVANVYRWSIPPPSGLSFPCVVVLDDAETLQRKTRETYDRSLTVTVQAIDKVAYGENPDPGTVVNRLLCDMEKAIESATMIAALRAVTGFVALRLVRSKTALAVPADPFCTVESTVEIDYRTTRADPSDGAP